MNKHELMEKLKRIDEDAFFRIGASRSGKAEAVIVGGSALLLCDLSAKETTKDVDIFQLNAETAVRDALYADPDFNSMCQAYAQSMPYNFEDRLQRVDIDTLAIDFYTPSAEDLAVMKLYRWEAPDKADLSSAAFRTNLDWDLLERLVYDPNEAAGSRSAEPSRDRELKQMRLNYEEFRKEWGS